MEIVTEFIFREKMKHRKKYILVNMFDAGSDSDEDEDESEQEDLRDEFRRKITKKSDEDEDEPQDEPDEKEDEPQDEPDEKEDEPRDEPDEKEDEPQDEPEEKEDDWFGNDSRHTNRVDNLQVSYQTPLRNLFTARKTPTPQHGQCTIEIIELPSKSS
jgi:hypothetical protein